MNKVKQLDDIIDGIKDGATIMIGGVLGDGVPLVSIGKLVKKNLKDLTIIAAAGTYPGGRFDLALLFTNRQVKKFITSHTGTSPEIVSALKAGEIEVDYFPLGTWIEKIRAGGAGLGGVLTPIGIGTLVEEGKQKLVIAGKSYLVELPLRAEYAFIAGYRGDALGNIEYRGTALNSNPIIAMASDHTVAEVNEIVGVGDIEPGRVGTPSVFVKSVVQGHTLDEHRAIYEDIWIRSGRLKVPAAALQEGMTNA
jgi:acetate CoA/acetoacetate CoA-transferase alpha subunit